MIAILECANVEIMPHSFVVGEPAFSTYVHQYMVISRCIGELDGIKLYRHPKLQLLSSIIAPAP